MKHEKLINIITSLLFVLILLSGGLSEIITPDSSVSISERRTLQQLPTLSLNSVTSGTFFEEFNDYVTDQLPLREQLRQLKAILHYYILDMTENNNIVICDNSAIKLQKHFNEKLTSDNVKTWSEILKNCLSEDINVLYSVIPDKAYYLSSDYPRIDYQKLFQVVSDNAPEDSAELNLFSSLSLNDYYKTDIHWKQNAIYTVAEDIAEYFNVTIDPYESYIQCEINDFYGTYYGQSALPMSPDTLVVMNNTNLSSMKVTYYRYENSVLNAYSTSVYNLTDPEKDDLYSLYLGGSEGIVEIINPTASSDKSLLVCRDSFASSLIPYLISGYQRIIMIDSRYVKSALLSDFDSLDLKDIDDVLFIYSVTTLTETKFR